jgi:hypothetical protein
MTDLEKQGLDAATTSPSASESDDVHEELRDEVTAVDHHRKGHVARAPSTTFAPMNKPAYNTQDGGSGLDASGKAVRTFSRRTAQSSDDAHFFGGSLSRTRTELELERHESRRQQRSEKGEKGNQGSDGDSEKEEPIIVHWEGDDDPENPQNFGFYYKLYLTIFGAVMVLNSTFTSSAPNGVSEMQEAYFGISQEVQTLTISLWVAGYCLGPLIWGPLSVSSSDRTDELVFLSGH